MRFSSPRSFCTIEIEFLELRRLLHSGIGGQSVIFAVSAAFAAFGNPLLLFRVTNTEHNHVKVYKVRLKAKYIQGQRAWKRR